MKGTEMTKQERESMLYDEFDKFTSEPGESIYSYYLRYAKLINDMNMIPMSMTPMQINTKFVNHLQPEWSMFVTAAKQARDLHSLYAFLKHSEKYAKEVREMRRRFPKPLALLANTYNPPPSYSSNQIQYQAQPSEAYQPYEHYQSSTPLTQQLIQSPLLQSYAPPVCTAQNFLQPITNFELRLIQELKLQFKTAKLWFRTFKEDSLKDFLADSLEETNDCEELQLQAIENFKADHIDAYDSDCDDKATANAIFMENLSFVGSLNDDTVAPHYDYDTLFESYDELKGNSDVISYTNYMLTIRDDADNYVPPPVQKNDMMLFVIEQMKSQVEKCTKVNQESKSEIKSLTSKLERYKDRVRVLRYAVKDGHSKQEAYLNRDLYTVISDHNRKVKDFEEQVFSKETQMKDLNNHIAFLKKNFETLKKESSKRIQKIEDENVSLAFQVIPKFVEKNDLSKLVTSHLTTKKIVEKCTKVLAPGLLKIETEPINALCLKFAARIQELLVYVSASCPFTQSGNEKWTPVTSHKRNNKPYVDASRMKQTFKTITKEHTVMQNTRKTDNTMLPSTGRVSSTNASGSKPRSNINNDRILQSSSKSIKNKLESHHRTFKSSANKNNHVSDCNANVKNAASTSAKPPTKNDLDLLFQPMFDEYFKNPSAASNPISAATLPPPDTA
ncbi:hypothetical protein Tco_0524354 [Tanacetum coccineum]